MTGIMQVVQTNKTDTFNTTSSGWQDVTGLSASITPSSATNTVIVTMKLSLGSDGSSGIGYRVVRDATNIDIGDAASSRTQASGVAFGTQVAADSGMSVAEEFLDSPAAAVAVTYKVQVNKGNSASVDVNAGATDSDTANYFRTTSNIVLQEFEP